ncbi:aromatic acid exporter family protein [Paenibacillus rhizophilus]|uniref:Aromatic acid exporter family protein n=1 Tax=Paenibacillus rhizophilus TaxID=1850366 RepID=A0A3N9PBA1_9BACL|nr:aromatic acid exporter family protein [Paenibacillus rhizophilus]
MERMDIANGMLRLKWRVPTLKIGLRTLKTAVGVSLSVMVSQLLQLQYFSSSGILTLLCIQKSRRKSIQAAVSRFFACIIGMFFATGVFFIFGYFPYSFLILMLLFIPLCVRLRIQEGIASSSVIVMHVYMHKEASLAFFANEFLVILVGLGTSLIINAYMPNIERQLNRCKEEVELLFQAQLQEIAAYLKDGNRPCDVKAMQRLSDVFKRAKSLVLLYNENHILGKDELYSPYFEKREQQYEALARMMPYVSRITVQMEQRERIGEFLLTLSNSLLQSGWSPGLHEDLCKIRQYHKLLPMPESRKEFEDRASLFVVANELELFLKAI